MTGRQEVGRRGIRLELTTDPVHGGRWTSLRSGRREWLWTNPAIEARRREGVRAGDPFVDAGGGEECWPTVRGRPDHGAVWSRSWTGAPSSAAVEVAGLGTLRRDVRAGTELAVDYRFHGRSGTRFLHAVHLLLDLSVRARLEVPQADRIVLLDGDRPELSWPAGFDRFGPDDGTAQCVLIPDCQQAIVIDGPDRLRFDWDAPGSSAPCSLLVWRNLGGWPAERPYRSIGIEPMVGRAADLSAAADEDCAALDSAGRFCWTLRLSAEGSAGQAV